MPRKLLTGEDLDQKVKELGVDPTGDQILGTTANVRHPRASDFELQRRVLEAERAIRESWLWKIAVASAVASAFSAAAAWVAVVRSVSVAQNAKVESQSPVAVPAVADTDGVMDSTQAR